MSPWHWCGLKRAWEPGEPGGAVHRQEGRLEPGISQDLLAGVCGVGKAKGGPCLRVNISVTRKKG